MDSPEASKVPQVSNSTSISTKLFHSMKSLVKKDAVYEISVNLQGKENDNEDCSTEDNLEEAPATFDDKDIDSTDELAGDLMDMILNDCKYSLDDIDDCKGRAEDSDDNDYPETITLQEESVVASDDGWMDLLAHQKKIQGQQFSKYIFCQKLF